MNVVISYYKNIIGLSAYYILYFQCYFVNPVYCTSIYELILNNIIIKYLMIIVLKLFLMLTHIDYILNSMT